MEEDYLLGNSDHELFLAEQKLDTNEDINTQSPISNALSNVEVKQEVTECEDEFDIFGRHVAAQLRQLGLVNALKAQSKIQSVLTELRIEEISQV